MKANAQYKAGRAEKRAHYLAATQQEIATEQADLENREQIRRTRMVQERFRGAQLGRIAGAGVVASAGSPLDLMAETAALQELEIQDQARAASTAYTRGYAQAEATRLAGKRALAGAKRASTATYIDTAASIASSYVRNRSMIPQFGVA